MHLLRRTVKIIPVATVIAVLLCLTFQVRVHAEKVYYISAYGIQVYVNTDGSADIEEKLTYNFSGQFRGALRDIDFSSTGGIVNQQVFVEKNGNPVAWELNSGQSIDSEGGDGTYNYSIDGNIAHFKVFEPSVNEEKTFVFKYRLLDVAGKYNDVAIFNRKMIDTGWKTRIDNISVQIHIPEGALIEDLKVFAHGPLTGTSEIADASTFAFTVPTVSPGEYVETLAIFPATLLPDMQITENRDALPGIMENEKALADEANKLRDQARDQVRQDSGIQGGDTPDRGNHLPYPYSNYAIINPLLVVIFTIFLSFFWVFLIVYIYKKYDRELKHSFQGRYYRELPGEYTPAEMSVLMSFGYVQSRDIMATLMDLVRKGILSLNTEKYIKKGFFGDKELSRYIIAIRSDTPSIPLKAHEANLIDWFIGKIGNGSYVDLDEIKEYVHRRSNALQFKSDYDNWCRIAKHEADRNGFFDTKSSRGRLIGVLSSLGYIGYAIFAGALLKNPVAVLPMVLGVILLIFSARIKRRTAYGNEQHAMWEAFKNFLKDFSRLDKAILPSIVIWEYYLVYAISLGVAKEVIKQLPLVFVDEDLNDNRLTFMHGAAFGYFAGFNTMFDDTIRTVEGAITSAVDIANSANSSSSGGGGGFSGGSSGGGGGGGGGGAF